jgi:hypothetical protein
MNQSHPMTRLEVVDIETLEVTKAVYMTTQDPKQIQAMSDSLLRNLNTFQFFVRATPSAAPVVPASTEAEVEGIATSKIPEGWPEELWLNAGDDELGPFSEYDEVTWCSLPQGENDIRYVREDLLASNATPAAVQGV